MALDSLESLSNLQKYLPDYIKNRAEVEYQEKYAIIHKNLSNVEIILKNKNVFMHTLRLISSFEETEIEDVHTLIQHKVFIHTQLWTLMREAYETNGSLIYLSRIAESLISLVQNIRCKYIVLSWMNNKKYLLKDKSNNTNLRAFKNYYYFYFHEKNYFNEIKKFVSWEFLMDIILLRFKRNFRDNVSTSSNRRKSMLQTYVRLVCVCRCFWEDDKSLNERLQKVLIESEANLMKFDSNKNEIFLNFRILLLFCTNSFAYEISKSGKLFEWWNFVKGRGISSWDGLFVCLLHRAIKYGWSAGRPLNRHIYFMLPFLLQILLKNLYLPTRMHSNFNKESIAGEYTPLLVKQLNIPRKIAKILVLLIEPQRSAEDLRTESAEIGRESKGNKKERGELVDELEKMTSMFAVKSGAEGAVERGVAGGNLQKNVFVYLDAIVSFIFPYTHPSNSGRWTSFICSFVNSLVCAYSRRVMRERAGVCTVRTECGRDFYLDPQEKEEEECKPGEEADNMYVLQEEGRRISEEKLEEFEESEEKLEESEEKLEERGKSNRSDDDAAAHPQTSFRRRKRVISLRLGRQDDVKFGDLIAPLLLQGMYSKTPSSAHSFEDSLKRICHLLPDKHAEPLILRLLESLCTVTETHQTQSSLRILTQIAQFVFKYFPSMLGEILQNSLLGIDAADPFKTLQTLTFFNVLFSFIPCADFSDLQIEESTLLSYLQKYRAAHNMSPLPSSASVGYDEAENKQYNRSNLSELSVYNYPLERRKVLSKNKNDIKYEEYFEERFFTLNNTKEILSQRKNASSLFPEFALLFFDNILKYIASATKPSDSATGCLMASVDRGTAMIIKSCTSAIFSQVEDSTYERLLHTFCQWLKCNIYSDAHKYVSSICFTFGVTRQKISCKILIKMIYNELIEEEETTNKFHDEKVRKNLEKKKISMKSTVSEDKVVWLMNAFNSLVRRCGKVLLDYKAEIVNLIDECLVNVSKKIFKSGIKLFRRVLESLMGIYFNDSDHTYVFSLKDKDADEEQQRNLLRFKQLVKWGSCWWFDEDRIEFDWHIISAEELQFCFFLIRRVFIKVEMFLKKAFPKEKLDEEDAKNLDIFFSYKNIINHDCFLQSLRNSDISYGDLATQEEDLTQEEEINEQEEIALKIKSLSPFILLSRTLLVARQLFKGISCLFPDELNRIQEQKPIISPVQNLLGKHIFVCFSNLVFLISKIQMGITVNEEQFSCTYSKPNANNALWKNKNMYIYGVEECKLLKKILKLCAEILVRRWSSQTPNSNNNNHAALVNSVSAWLSCTAGVYHNSSWFDLSRLWLSERVLQKMTSRVDTRRANHPFEGVRKKLIIYIANLSLFYYSEIRITAQQNLKDACACHYGCRTSIIRFFISELEKSSLQFSEANRSNMQKKEISAIEDSVMKERSRDDEMRGLLEGDSAKGAQSAEIQNGEQASCSKSPPTSHGDSTVCEAPSADLLANDLPYAKITGVTFSLNSLPMLRRIWTSFELTAKLLKVLCSQFNNKIEKDSIHKRLSNLTLAIFNARQALILFSDSNRITSHEDKENVDVLLRQDTSDASPYNAFYIHIEQGLLIPLLENLLKSNSQSFHWRHVLMCTCVFVIFISYPKKSNGCGIRGSSVSRHTLNMYLKWLLKACDSSAFSPLVNTAAVFGLMLVLNAHNKRRVEIDLDVMEELHSVNVFTKFVKTCCIIHHESARSCSSLSAPSSSSSSNAYAENAYNIVVSIIKIDKSWPTDRTSRFSTYFSLHNALFFDSYFSFLFKTKPLIRKESCLDEAHIAKSLNDLSMFNTSEIEQHISFVEILCSFIRNLRKIDFHLQAYYWKLIYPIMCLEITKADQDRIFDWIDGLRFSLHNLKERHMNVFLPLFNFVMNSDNENSRFIHNYDDDSLSAHMKRVAEFYIPPVETSQSSANSAAPLRTFETTKRMRLLEALFIEVSFKYPPLIYASANALKSAISHPYKQIREEVGRIMFLLSSIASQKFCNNELRNFIFDLKHLFIDRAKSLIDCIDNDSSSAAHNRLVGESRPAELCAAESILYYLMQIYMFEQGVLLKDEKYIRIIIQFVLVCYKNSDIDLTNSALNLAILFASSSMHFEILDGSKSDIINRLNESRLTPGIVECLYTAYTTNSSWKVRNLVIQITELLGCHCRMLLYQSEEYGNLIKICVLGLSDYQTEVRLSSKAALSSLFITCTNEQCHGFTMIFKKLAGLMNKKIENLEEIKNFENKDDELSKGIINRLNRYGRMTGVLGLASLVLSAPFSVPAWLPNTITSLALCGHSKMPDNIRREVEKCLQEFYRTHQDAWTQIHAQKFSQNQLDILETYKGRPIYFA